MSESSGTITTCTPVAYESVKSTFFCLSGVTVRPAIAMSALPPCTDVSTDEKSISSTTSSRPSFAAIFSAISTSIPSNPPLSSVISYGGKAAFVAI